MRDNHGRVLSDVCNPGPLNIDGKPLTQLELRRVAAEDAHLADQALKEVARRVLGEGWSDPTTAEQGTVWAATMRKSCRRACTRRSSMNKLEEGGELNPAYLQDVARQ